MTIETTPRRPGWRPVLPIDLTPKLFGLFREGYGAGDLSRDTIAGLTVAVVALPLSMAIAIASGTTPDRGLFTAIVAGTIISAFGGSRYQIGGPAGAFIVLVASIIERQGFDGFAVATMMAGAVLILVGLLRLGSYIRYIPHPVTVGFTAGIGVIIFASQIKDLLGLTLPGKEPSELLPKLVALAGALQTTSATTLAIAALALGIILLLRRLRPHWPGLLIAVAATAALAALLHLPVETIGTRFGGIPRSLPAPALPHYDWSRIGTLVPDALSLALLGGIESLLSAVVADGMTGRRHRANCELVAQGLANIASPLFGGLCATGTIARTATNVRAGARSPVAGILHAVFLLAFMALAAPLASYIPLAALGAVLAIVAWNMVERHAFVALLRSNRAEAAVLLATFGLTIFRDLTEGIAVGLVMASFIFVDRMARAARVTAGVTAADSAAAQERPFSEDTVRADDVIVFRLSGPFFFGSAAEMMTVIERLGTAPRGFVLDMSEVPMIDTTGGHELGAFIARARRSGAGIALAGVSGPVRAAMTAQRLDVPGLSFVESVEAGSSLLRA